jgi:hypothetical protein
MIAVLVFQVLSIFFKLIAICSHVLLNQRLYGIHIFQQHNLKLVYTLAIPSVAVPSMRKTA